MNRRGSMWIVIAIIVIVLIVAAILIVWVVSSNNKGSAVVTQPAAVQSTPTSTVTYIPNGDVPVSFPAGLPIDDNVQVLQTFQTNNIPQNPTTTNATTTFVQQQSVYEYATTLTIAAAYADYAQYFSKNGWQTLSTFNGQNIQSITVERGGVSISATFGLNSILQKNSVNLTLSYYAPYFPPNTPIVTATPQMIQQFQSTGILQP